MREGFGSLVCGMNGKLAEANGLMAEADKAASSGFFKKPDWAKAAATYAKAAVAFKVSKNTKLRSSLSRADGNAQGTNGCLFVCRCLFTPSCFVLSVCVYMFVHPPSSVHFPSFCRVQ